MNRHEFLKTVAAATASILAPQWSSSDEPSEVKTFTYKTAGGCEIKLDAFGSDPNVRKPVIVHIHGGALIIGSRKNPPKWLNPQGDHVLISIDYRLAPETKLPAIIEDVQDAFRWIHKKGPRLLNIDTEKVSGGRRVGGRLLDLDDRLLRQASPQGAHRDIRLWRHCRALVQPAERHYLQQPRVSKEEAYAAVGATCVSEGPGTRGKFYLYCRQNGIWPQEVTGHNPDTEPRWFDRYCPVRNVSAKYPPTVLIHGTADTDVPYEESVGMDKALTQFNVPHKFITVPGGRPRAGWSLRHR